MGRRLEGSDQVVILHQRPAFHLCYLRYRRERGRRGSLGESRKKARGSRKSRRKSITEESRFRNARLTRRFVKSSSNRYPLCSTMLQNGKELFVWPTVRFTWGYPESMDFSFYSRLRIQQATYLNIVAKKSPKQFESPDLFSVLFFTSIRYI